MDGPDAFVQLTLGFVPELLGALSDGCVFAGEHQIVDSFVRSASVATSFASSNGRISRLMPVLSITMVAAKALIGIGASDDMTRITVNCAIVKPLGRR